MPNRVPMCCQPPPRNAGNQLPGKQDKDEGGTARKQERGPHQEMRKWKDLKLANGAFELPLL